jgi:tetratricopeptide (TPR) repeat protein
VKHLSLRRSQWIFLLIMAVFSLGFTFGINFDIGMSRDWDLLVPYNIALVIASAFAWFHFVGEQRLRQRLMVMMSAVTLLHTAGFVMVNAQVQPSIERFRTLRDPRVWGPAAMIYANEDLGTYYRELGDFTRAVEYYREGLAIDSTNSRRWLAVASVYQSLGQMDNYRYALEKAVDTGTRNIQVHIQLGQTALQEGNIDRAIETWKKGLDAEPNALILSYYIGATLADRKHAYEAALPYLLRAGRAFPNEPEVLNAIGACYYRLGKTTEMKFYWGKLLQIAPNYPQANSIRKLLAQSQ